MQIPVKSEVYDATGAEVPRSHLLHYDFFRQSLQIEQFINVPVSVKTESIEEIISWLLDCEYISDLELYGELDRWVAPDEFERIRKGDCEDFSLWAWRQLIRQKKNPRFVVGRLRGSENYHAWITFEQDGLANILETTSRSKAFRLPMSRQLDYVPMISITYDGIQCRYFVHEELERHLDFTTSVAMIHDWLVCKSGSSIAGALLMPVAIIASPFLCLALIVSSFINTPGGQLQGGTAGNTGNIAARPRVE